MDGVPRRKRGERALVKRDVTDGTIALGHREEQRHRRTGPRDASDSRDDRRVRVEQAAQQRTPGEVYGHCVGEPVQLGG